MKGALQDILREVHVYTPNTDESIQIDPNAPELSHPLNQYGFIASEKSSIDFGLKVCHDAFIYLSASLVMDSTADVYEIVMGGGSGTKVFLRSKNGVDVAQGLLGTSNTDCDQFVPFWISWENGNVKIGKGLIINQDVVIDWTDSDPFIIAGIGVRTGYGSSGQWVFHVEASGEFCVTGGTRGTMNLLTTDIVREYDCPLMCLRVQNCMGFNFNKLSEICELISGGEEMTTVSNSDWIFGTKCFQNKCLACF
ncbi:Hypothetical predicted protein [Mytilus galloprovincialis]|uniref:Farnesoic acid O-methyl transferase domain-containing protein n=1 Tax=Mytilus galloprovincialis TaxID=29158 RepID=A0A8B6EXI7_MYTGA|nr:Hypothetical predicted protein [Mytilus galloprovincialis]